MSRANPPPSASTLRILCATDNHLGYLSGDPIRGNDSFRTMDEILQIGRDHRCDLVVLGGDLFHDNKPSRRTMFETQKVFKKHVFGDGPVNIKLVSDQALNFDGRHVNYEDPNLSVQLPIFIIHGNHDDPTREANSNEGGLSALDLLAEAGLVNYFGRLQMTSTDPVKLRPVLIEKGEVKLALYGMGWVRDERFNHYYTKNLVSFVQPAQATTEWFNLFLIHQNREDRNRGPKNCVPEKVVPPWMHLVLWGHEHGCEIDPLQRPEGWYFSQPGSSVACSLVEHEAIPKHVGILDVRLNSDRTPEFQMRKLLLKSVRPFFMRADIQLDKQGGTLSTDLPEGDKAEHVFRFLTAQVSRMLKEYDQTTPPAPDRMLPLIRLKVEHTDFPTINADRFGAQFVSQVANPTDLLLFWKRKTATSKSRPAGIAGADDEAEEDDGDAAEFNPLHVSPQETIARLVEEQFGGGVEQMKLFDTRKFNEALEAFVAKDEKNAIQDFVDDAIVVTLKEMKRTSEIKDTAALAEQISKVAMKERAQTEIAAVEVGALAGDQKQQQTRPAAVASLSPVQEEEEDEEKADAEIWAAKSTVAVKSASKSRKRTLHPSEEEEDQDQAVSTATKTAAAAVVKKKKRDEDEPHTAKGPATSKSKAKHTEEEDVRKPATRPMDTVIDMTGDDDDAHNNQGYIAPRPSTAARVRSSQQTTLGAKRPLVDDEETLAASIAPLSQAVAKPKLSGFKVGKAAKR